MIGAFAGNGLFGSLLGDPEIASVFAAEPFVARMVQFERAWTESLRDTGAIPGEDAEAALARLQEYRIDLDALAMGSERDGLPVPAMIAALKSGMDRGSGALHYGATSQDVIDTATVLCLRDVTAILDHRLTRVRDTLSVLSERHGHRPLQGYTRMQAALPITVAARLAAWSGPLVRAGANLTDASEALPIQYGGPVGARSVPEGRANEMAAALSRRLDLPRARVWHSDRSPMIEYGNALTALTGALAKIGQDIALMALLDDGSLLLRTGGASSAMAHKNNPVEAEILVALGRLCIGLNGTLSQSLISEFERSGSAWALEWMTLPQMAEAAGCALRTASRLLGNVESIGAGDGSQG